MDQIVFIIDLESFLPRTLEQIDDGFLEKFLNNVKKALIRILTHGRVIERRRDLSSFGFRFYSSTDYFSVPSQISGDWFDLCLSSWGTLEDTLTQRFDSVLGSLQRTPPGTRLCGRQTPGAALCKVLEEVTALYSWDRPALFSPIKSAKKSELKFGNSVFVITKLPVDDLELNEFLNNEKQVKHKVRDVVDAITSKRVKNHFTGELNISLHILNAVQYDFNPDIIQLFNKALKDFKGGVLQLSTLSSSGCTTSSSDATNSILQPSKDTCSLPATCLFTCHLSESSLPVKMLERNYYGQGEVTLDNNVVIKVEYVSNAQSRQLSSGLSGLGVTSVKMFNSVHRWEQCLCVWSQDHHDHSLVSLLTYLQHSQQCLVLEDPNQQILVMFPNSRFTGTIASLDKVESHFYHKQMSHQFSIPKISNNPELEAILENIELIQFSPSRRLPTKPSHSKPSLVTGFDFSSLEPWRLPNSPNPSFLEKVKTQHNSKTSQHSEYHKMMLSVRESYTSRTGIRFETEKLEDKKKFGKKPSAMSNASTVSAGSGDNKAVAGMNQSRKSMSRGEMLRMKSMNEFNKSVSVIEAEESKKKDATEIYLAEEKESVIAAKLKSANEFQSKIGNSHGTDTSQLIETLLEIGREVVMEEDDIKYAGYSEACISVLLKHLDTSGVSKASLEDVVTSRLLLDVASVARLADGDLKLRTAQHKVQVLLRSEVHWLLACPTRLEEYEESILAHLRQVTLHAGNQTMVDFLTGVLTQVHVDRQPELICLLYDELEQERPSHLLNLFSPIRSIRSTSSAQGSVPGASMQPPALHLTRPASNKVNLSRSFRSRPKSFDTSLTSRQIDLSAASRRQERKGAKVVTTGRMVSNKSRLSSKKRLLTQKSPKKTKQMVKRNLNFESSKNKSPDKFAKSPRKNVSVTTPSKARKFSGSKIKFTPGKKHRVLCPETPTHKKSRKSDGNTSIAETPEKMMTPAAMTPRRQQASLALRRKASFYSGAVSRSVKRFEDSQSASMIVGNASVLDFNSSCLDQTGLNDSGLNKSQVLFANIVNRKRKRESIGPGGDEEETMLGKSPMRKVRKRLNSFSDPAGRPLESTHLGGTLHLGSDHHLDPNISNIPALNKTPVKNVNKTPSKKFMSQEEEFFSPSKRVIFNLKPQPPTPKSGIKAKSILKTPSKESPKVKDQSPHKTPSKAVSKLMLSPSVQSPLATHCSSRTPVKTTPRRDIGQSLTRSISLNNQDLQITPSKKDVRQVEETEKQPSSPIIRSSHKKSRNPSSASTVSIMHGFNTPSPSIRTKSTVLSTVQELLMSEDSQSPKAPHCQAHFQPSLMSTLTPGAKKYFKDPPPTSFNPCHASTEKDFKFPSSSRTIPIGGRKTPEPLMTTQDIINSTTMVNLSTTLKPSDNVPTNIFDNSALIPSRLSNTIVPLQTSPKTTPPKSEQRTPIKSDHFGADNELELVSPSKKVQIDNIVRSLEDSDDEEEIADLKPKVRFGKTDSEQSVATSLERATPEPNPSSGYSSEPHPEPPTSPDSSSDQDPSSPCQVQVSSPTKPMEDNVPKVKKLSKELAGLQDLMSPYFSADGSRRRSTNIVESQEKVTQPQEPSVGKRKRSTKPERKSSKRKSSVSEDVSTSSKKSSRRSIRPMFYKEIDSENDSQTDEDELVRIVEERFAEDDNDQDQEEELNKKSKKMLILQSPARFKCQYCGSGYRSKKDLKRHEMKELEQKQKEIEAKRKEVDDEESGSDFEYEHEVSVKEPKDEAKFTPEIEISEKTSSKTPKAVSGLQDQLSSYFSPSSSTESRSRKTTERLSDLYSLSQMTPKSSKPSHRTLVRTRTLLKDTSTPNDGVRSARKRPISYAEFPDFDTSGSDFSFNDSGAGSKNHLGKRFSLSSRRSSISPALINTSVSSINGSKRLVVKDLNDSQEIHDMDRVVPKVISRDPSPLQTTPNKSSVPLNISVSSPGKYTSIFSVTERIETPTGQIKLKLNRRSKPQQSSTPVTFGKSTDPPLRSLIIPARLNRSACKEMGLSPNKVLTIQTSKTPPKPKRTGSVITPEKENKPHQVMDTCSKLKKEHDISKTPRIRIKKVNSKFGTDSSSWEAEQILSPQKTASPLKSLPSLGESPVKSFSPLSSVSLHKLTTSPIINTQVDGKKKRKGSKVNKQLAYI